MYCDSCGTPIPAEHRFCGSCGKPVGISVAPPAEPNRVGRHLHLLGILWIIASSFHLIGAGVLFSLANTMGGHVVFVEGDFPLQAFLHALLNGVAFFVLLTGLTGIATGWGLMEKEPWARTAALVLGFLILLHAPFGTALGIYTLWVLLPQHASAEYQRLAAG